MANLRLRSLTGAAAYLLAFAALIASLPTTTEAGILTQITDSKTTRIGSKGATYGTEYFPASACLDDAGSAVFVNASTNQLGGNPGHLFQIFRFDAVTGAGQQVTTLPQGVSDLPGTVSVSDDGQWLAFISRSDPVGQNHDASPEVFVMRTDGSGLAQRSSDPAVNGGVASAVALSGSANRILFLSNSNPLGANASNRIQLFDVDFDGANLRQLTTVTTTASWYGISISDDGQRIVFATTANLTGGNADRSPEVFAIQADGTNLRQLTSGSGRDLGFPMISGDGSKIAFWALSSATSAEEIFAIGWDGSGLRQLTTSSSSHDARNHSVTDDGQFVFFATNRGNAREHYEIWKIKTDGTGLTQLTTTPATFTLDKPVVAGGGGRVAYYRKRGDYSYYEYDEPGALCVMSATGTGVLPLVVANAPDSEIPSITRDGTKIAFSSTMNPFGTNPDGGYEVFTALADGTGPHQVTNISSGDAWNPSITADGATIVFTSDGDPLGQNADGLYEIFLVHADGTGLRQLTFGAPGYFQPMISANGTTIVFTSYADMYFSEQIYKIDPEGNILTQLTPSGGGSSLRPRVDDTGTWIVFESWANLDGTSPNGLAQVYRMRTSGTGLQRVSTDPTRIEDYPDISASGTRIVYYSSADPLGTNPSHRTQIFLYETATSLTRQLTFAQAGTPAPPSISGDGSYVYFLSTTPYDEDNPNSYWDLYRVPAAGGAVERIGARTPSPLPNQATPRADMNGSRIALEGREDPIERNPDRSWEVVLVDMAKEPEIRVGRSAPTLVSWDYEAGPIRYDVIRGDVANLGPGLSGTVSLGPVVCLENDSPDADTRGFEDAVQPAAGQAFFFIFRGSRGLNYGPGSWGQSASGYERLPASGSCAP